MIPEEWRDRKDRSRDRLCGLILRHVNVATFNNTQLVGLPVLIVDGGVLINRSGNYS